MSDYSETFSKIDGQVIEAADFETEFQAITTASATKLDKTASAGDLTIGGGTAYGLTMLDTPTALVSASATTEDTWTAYSGSDLSSLNAKIAIVYFEANVAAVSATFNNCELHLRKNGSSVLDRVVGYVSVSEAGTDTRDTVFGVEALVELDGSGHFDYKFEGGASGGTGSVTINLNGYYT